MRLNRSSQLFRELRGELCRFLQMVGLWFLFTVVLLGVRFEMGISSLEV